MSCWLHMSLCIIAACSILHANLLAFARTLGSAEHPSEEAIHTELWLDDITKDYLYDVQADSPGGLLLSDAIGFCPQPTEDGRSHSCKARKCSSDKDCAARREKCCYNGCTYTCLAVSPSHSVIDWRQEPPSIGKSDSAWLIPADSELDHTDIEAEWCSTNMLLEDEDALLCPHGYQCHIDAPGDPQKNIPNIGRCVQDFSYDEGSDQTFRIFAEQSQDGRCFILGWVQANGSTFTYQGHTCLCTDGAIECVVGRSDLKL